MFRPVLRVLEFIAVSLWLVRTMRRWLKDAGRGISLRLRLSLENDRPFDLGKPTEQRRPEGRRF